MVVVEVVVVAIEVGERGAVGAAVPLGREASRLGAVGELPRAVVQQQRVRVTVVGVVIRGRHRAAQVRLFPLADEEIEVAVKVDVRSRHRVLVFVPALKTDARFGGELSAGAAGPESQQAVLFSGRDEVHMAVAVEVGKNPRFAKWHDGIPEHRFVLEPAAALVPVNEVAPGEDDLR